MANTLSDRVASHVLKWTDKKFKHTNGLKEEATRGNTVHQELIYLASIMRSKYGTYREYHTSLDILGKVVTPKGLEEDF